MEQKKGESTDRLELNQTLGVWTDRYSLQSASVSSKCKLHTLIYTFVFQKYPLHLGANRSPPHHLTFYLVHSTASISYSYITICGDVAGHIAIEMVQTLHTFM